MKLDFKTQKLALAIALACGALVGCDSDDDNDITINNPDIGGGKVLLYTTAGEYIDTANVGNLPDMVKFVDADTLVVANEGEPEDDYVSDDEGSISIITLSSEKSVVDVTTLDFSDDQLEGDVRIKPDSSAAADLEPEYVAVNAAGDTAWVTLQENNAVAIVDIANKSITQVKALGKVTVANQAMDITDDGIANPVIGNPENIFALYMPDTIVAFNVDGNDYYVTANEGDDREYGDYEDLEKANKLALSAELEAAVVTPDLGMEKLRVLSDLGDTNNDGIYEELYMTGTRSFTIWDAQGNIVFDSAAQFEEEIAASYTAYFNTRVDDTDDAEDIQELIDDGMPYEMVGDTAYFWEGVDARTLKKGVEPEALAVHAIGDKVFAYIGLEKQGGFFVYDVTSPANASMVEYFNDVDYSQFPTAAGDLAPEGMIAFEQDGGNYLAVANELSSTLAIFALADDGTVTKLTSLSVGSFDEGAAEIVDYSPIDKALFVTNAETSMVDIIDVSTPATPSVTSSIDFSEHASDVQSVSVKDGVLAIAVK